MKWFIGTVSILILITLAVGRLYTPSVTAVQPLGTVFSPQALVTILNRERASVGAPPLKLDDRLNATAQAKADDMVKNGYYGHVNPQTGEKSTIYIKQYMGYSCKDASENLTGTYIGGNPLKRWDESPPHKAAQLNTRYDIVGFASYINADNYSVYVAHFCDL